MALGGGPTRGADHGRFFSNGSAAQAWAEALTARRAKTKADPESDDDELLGAALEAERLSAFNLESRTNSSVDNLTDTGSNWAVHK